jgi:ribosomal-protein-alanine N-acetyltransferase
MENLKIETDRLIITQFDEGMAESVHINSLDEDNRRFVPDEVFETVQEAHDTIVFLIECYKGMDGPFVYPILLKSGVNIGYVQAVPIGDEWEVGYHIATDYTRKGFATEAVNAFVPLIMKRLSITHIWGICRGDNIASRKVLEKCSFVLEHKGFGNYKGENHEIFKYLFTLS